MLEASRGVMANYAALETSNSTMASCVTIEGVRAMVNYDMLEASRSVMVKFPALEGSHSTLVNYATLAGAGGAVISCAVLEASRGVMPS